MPDVSPALDGPRLEPRSGVARQLVVICHGYGADGRDMIGLGEAWAGELPDAAFVAPHGIEPCPHGMRQWFDLEDRTPALLERGVRRAAAALLPFVEAELGRLGLPAEACALAGFSQGCMLALFAGLRRAVPPRGVLGYSGALLAPEALAGEMAHPVPVLLVHGTGDEVVPVARSREAERALREAGVPVETHWTEGLGHTVDGPGLGAGGAFLRRVFAVG